MHEGLAYGLPAIVTDQVGAGDDLVDPGVNGYVVPTGSSPALAEAMRAIAGWTPEQWERIASRSTETLAACSLDRAVEGFVRGCSRGTSLEPATPAWVRSNSFFFESLNSPNRAHTVS